MGTNPPIASPKRTPRPQWRSCLLRSFITLVVLLLLLTGAWFFALRPPLHAMAEEQMGQVLSATMGQVNPLLTALVPAGIPLPVNETMISKALVIPKSSWFTIQNMQLSITPENILANFQVQLPMLTFPCTITSVPQVVNGQVVINDMKVDGPISLVMSTDEMKAEVNTYLSQLRERMHRPITALTLEDHFLWVTLG